MLCLKEAKSFVIVSAMNDTLINLEATLFCGQTFAWTKEGPTYEAVLGGRHIMFEEADFPTLVAEDATISHYFDMEWEYDEAERELSALDPHLSLLISQYRSIHILNQDPWEVLVSFLLSQNNNIKRIRGMYQTLSRTYGTEVSPGVFSFPRPEQLEGVSETAFRALGMGFRAPYLVSAISHADLLESIESLDYLSAKELLKSIRGVGEKVASCILLFGYHHMEAFPLDTWMQKVMKRHYPTKDETFFAPYAALAQQYLFHGERLGGKQ